MERWQGLAGVHARLVGRGAGASVAGSAPDADRMLAALLDLATLTRLLGRLAPALLSGEFVVVLLHNSNLCIYLINPFFVFNNNLF